MDLNQHSFIRTAFDDQTILISKAKFETAVHIHQTNTGTMLMRPFFSIEWAGGPVPWCPGPGR